MYKILSVLVLAALAADTLAQRFIHPTYRPPPKRPVIIRARRDTGNQEPLWLNQGDIPKAPATGDHPYLPNIIDDIKLDPNRRYARSVDSPSARGHSSGSHSTSSGSRDTGATHPGYNRRNARDTRDQEPLWLNQGDIPKAPASGNHPFLPKYIDDIKLDPNTRYARSVDSPSARGHSRGSHSTSSGSRDTGATHPGYNRRNARDTRDQEPLWLYQGDIPKAPATADHPFLPKFIDDIKLDPNTRVTRSIGSQSFMPGPNFPRPPTGPFNPFPKPGPPRRPFPIYA